MNLVMIEKWNSVVKPEDTVIYVGDFSWLGTQRSKIILNQLNGKKIMVLGNHDGSGIASLFSEVHEQLTIKIADQDVLVCHYPYAPSKWSQWKIKLKGWWYNTQPHQIKYLEKRPIDKGGWLIHGHVHQLYKIRNKMINVSVEVLDYTPISIDQIAEIILNK